jgi:hypothetical protein
VKLANGLTSSDSWPVVMLFVVGCVAVEGCLVAQHPVVVGVQGNGLTMPPLDDVEKAIYGAV